MKDCTWGRHGTPNNTKTPWTWNIFEQDDFRGQSQKTKPTVGGRHLASRSSGSAVSLVCLAEPTKALTRTLLRMLTDTGSGSLVTPLPFFPLPALCVADAFNSMPSCSVSACVFADLGLMAVCCLVCGMPGPLPRGAAPKGSQSACRARGLRRQ